MCLLVAILIILLEVGLIFFFLYHVAVVSQAYAVNVLDEYVLRGNPGILKCHIPSFVADYVYVEAWIQNEKVKFTLENSRDYGTY